MPSARQSDANQLARNSESDAGHIPVVPAAVSFDALAGGANEVVIRHRGQEYRLRTTRNGGLILNK